MPAYRQYTRTQRAMCVFTGEELNVEEIIREPMSLYTNASKSDIDEQIVELLKKVGMNMKESVLFFLLEVHFLV